MPLKNSHCSYCGGKYPTDSGWPRDCPRCRKRSYLNPLPVVVAIVPLGRGLVGVRRKIEPSRGKLTLPGGYLDCGESWQEGTSRELMEETGIWITPDKFMLYDVANGIDNTIVIMGIAPPVPGDKPSFFTSDETEEVIIIDRPMQLGFPLHTQVVARYFAARNK